MIIEIRGQKVLLDSDVAKIYDVEVKRINEAVKNNPDKFPNGYIIELNDDEWQNLKSKFLTSSWGGKRKLPKAFTEKGLYMLATILKSKRATKATIAIIETFTKIRELSRTIKKLPSVTDKKEQQSLMQKSGEIIAEILDDSLETDESETTIELNLAVLKFKHTIKKRKNG
ncbi:ORF6N domain-containing protein [Hydrogenimonas thermophila]|uniref:ORF6N domain-containing protein n=1 Tax=Hydrogenimonas thermophila TaxID=223786 RepID=UPI002936E994|nr:ORF6N domain-containing protein [Hydrogenimonas thermophila]WOE69033.1 ORF6N domain-containing protein [Hydrogenimonas thermophila]WOE71543.1 ORF6N domain-containing protein [Hydrogenimonas thermophila]